MTDHETEVDKAKVTKKAAPPAGKSAPVLPWMRVPITIGGEGIALDKISGLPSTLASAIKKRLGFEELFPVQCAVWRETAGGLSDSNDLCIACPTGSGKTLAYALPMINSLTNGRTVGCHRLQALVVLPTRDLALQVYEVFHALCPSVGLQCGLACGGGKSLEQEARCLMDPPSWLHRPQGSQSVNEQRSVDVLVATPGRLVAHLEGSEGFTLSHLRFLVVDETDRLMRQAYSDWLPKVLALLKEDSEDSRERERMSQLEASSGRTNWPRRRVVKLVVSATLTRDPSKLKRLDLHCPRYIAASAEDHRYHLPRELQEFKILCKSSSEKPLVILALLDELTNEGEGKEGKGGGIVVFTSSVDMTHKLFLMLEAAAMGSSTEGKVVEFSSHVDVKARSRSLSRFKSGAAKILVASDAMTRGMDVDCIVNVVNYDTPSHAKTYVHRAGRTARAGRNGRVFSLLRSEDVHHFKQMIRKVDNRFVKDWKGGTREKIEACQPRLDSALNQVQELLAAEAKQQASGGRRD